MELNREQIVKQMQEWCDNMCENACLKGEILNERVHTCEICFPNTVKNALALIKELTEENESWQKSLITQKENADKAYYELACEVENLRAENERLREDNEIKSQKRANIFEIANAYERGKADTVRKMQGRLKAEIAKYTLDSFQLFANSFIDQIAKEMLEGGDGIQDN